MKTNIELPEIFKYMHGDGLLSIEDVVETFGFSKHNSLSKSIKLGGFPKADVVQKSGTVTKRFWYKDTIITEINRRNQPNPMKNKKEK